MGIMGSLRASVFSRDAVIGFPSKLDARKQLWLRAGYTAL
jgi:hypothetical protein